MFVTSSPTVLPRAAHPPPLVLAASVCGRTCTPWRGAGAGLGLLDVLEQVVEGGAGPDLRLRRVVAGAAQGHLPLVLADVLHRRRVHLLVTHLVEDAAAVVQLGGVGLEAGLAGGLDG